MNREPKTILLATDGTPASVGARAAAAHLCRRGGAALHLVHASSPWTESSDDHAAMAWAIAQTERKLIEEGLGCAVAGVHNPRGPRAEAILATAAVTAADMVIIGGRQLNRLADLFTYRVSRRVVGAAHLPVLMVPGGGSAWPPHHVVIGCDGSPEARHAAQLAAWIARLAEADVIVAGVANGEDLFESPIQAHCTAETCAAEVRASGVAQTVSTQVAICERADLALRDLCETTGERVLLAVGARGSSALRRPGHASVSRALIEHTRVPVLLVPPALLGQVVTHRTTRDAVLA
jgi:nucleotide-binding universal stress UspA family protein